MAQNDGCFKTTQRKNNQQGKIHYLSAFTFPESLWPLFNTASWDKS